MPGPRWSHTTLPDTEASEEVLKHGAADPSGDQEKAAGQLLPGGQHLLPALASQGAASQLLSSSLIAFTTSSMLQVTISGQHQLHISYLR